MTERPTINFELLSNFGMLRLYVCKLLLYTLHHFFTLRVFPPANSNPQPVNPFIIIHIMQNNKRIASTWGKKYKYIVYWPIRCWKYCSVVHKRGMDLDCIGSKTDTVFIAEQKYYLKYKAHNVNVYHKSSIGSF